MMEKKIMSNSYQTNSGSNSGSKKKSAIEDEIDNFIEEIVKGRLALEEGSRRREKLIAAIDESIEELRAPPRQFYSSKVTPPNQQREESDKREYTQPRPLRPS